MADVAGFAALVLIGSSSLAMLFRRALIARTKNLAAIRWLHLSLSGGAAAALTLHIALLFGFPLTAGLLFGYAAFGASIAVWFTGGAFVERVRGSLTFHGQLTIIMIALILMHAAATSVALVYLSPVIFAGVALLALVNGVYHLSKLRESTRG